MVLIHLRSNSIFDLNETSARLWELLALDSDLPTIEAQLAQEFSVDAEIVHGEVAATLSIFAENDLIIGHDRR